MTGARVELREMRTQLHWAVDVPPSGRFAFAFLAPGNYQLLVEQIGFRPARVVDVEVAPGVNTQVRVRLAAAVPPVTKIDTVVSGGALEGGSGGGPSVRSLAIARLPYRRLDLGEPARLSSQLDADLGADGLPSRSTLVAVNGFPHDVARHPYLPGNLPGLPVPQASLSRIDVITAPLDADWADFSGALINATTPSGTRHLAGQLFGDWTGDAVATSGVFDPGGMTFQSVRGGASISGPIVPDTAVLIATVQGQLDREPLPPAWIATGSNSVLKGAAGSAPIDPLLATRLVSNNRIDGYTRLDWQLTSRHRAIVSAGLGVSRQSEPLVGALGIPGPDQPLDSHDAFADALVTSRFKESLANEFRTGFERSDRDYRGQDAAGAYLTTGERLGTDPSLPASMARTGARVDDRLHLTMGSHHFKLGVAGSFSTYSEQLSFGQRGTYWFDDAAAFAAGRGAFLGLSGQAPAASFTVSRLGFLFQDRWTILSGLDLYTAIRYDVEYLPGNEIPFSRDWATATGLDNRAIPSSVDDWSPRFGFTWRVGSSDWLLRGGVGLYRDLVDPAVLGELAQESGGIEVQRGIGAIGAWPNAPAAINLTDAGTRLSLLGPNYQTPRSAKATFGLARLLGNNGILSLELKYRHTDFLLRRHDLNRLPGAVSFDQYDRPLYASLVKEGSLLASAPTSRRRFNGFEMVSALDPDGSSTYRGVTAELQRSLGGMVLVRAAYTFSRTTDDWLSGLGGGPYAQLSPFPDSLNGRDWNDGRSDFDAPHRGTVGLEVRPLGAKRPLSLDVRYVIQSGRPFTPGFSIGVDANGDGSATNDPAYVDDKVGGMNALLAQWNCLGPQVGGFAQRNSCREPAVQSLNLRLALGPFLLRTVPVGVTIDALNVTDEALAIRDHALLMVDRTAPLSVNATTGDVTVPLAANPNFGQPLAYRAAGRSLRVSVKVGF